MDTLNIYLRGCILDCSSVPRLGTLLPEPLSPVPHAPLSMESSRFTPTHTPVRYEIHPGGGLTHVSHSGAMPPWLTILPAVLGSPVPTATCPLQLTSEDLEDPSDVEPAALGEGEELAEEQEQRQNAEDDGQDHGGLDRLQPF